MELNLHDVPDQKLEVSYITSYQISSAPQTVVNLLKLLPLSCRPCLLPSPTQVLCDEQNINSVLLTLETALKMA